ncbi:hypothetical protein BHM03_00053183 [Ensete ventricosum]|nr:hypothetical protein BHM03_00053183 [Ensete ventricosum]
MVDPDAPSPSTPSKREYLHCSRDFAAVYNLGDPVAAMFFNCQRENGCGVPVTSSAGLDDVKSMLGDSGRGEEGKVSGVTELPLGPPPWILSESRNT